MDSSADARAERLLAVGLDWDKLGQINVAGSGWISGQPPWHRGCEHYFLYDVRALTGEMILDALGLEAGDVTVVMGGPPCQGYSAAGKQNIYDPRNSLLFEFARLVCEIMPRTFVMENVPRPSRGRDDDLDDGDVGPDEPDEPAQLDLFAEVAGG